MSLIFKFKGISICVKLVHSRNSPPAISHKFLDKITSDKLVHSAKQSWPVCVTLSGNFIVFRLLHSANARLSTTVTLSGILTFTRLMHFSNALVSIVITVCGILISSNPVHPSNNFSATLVVPSSKIIVFKFTSSLKGPESYDILPPHDFNFFGIFMVLRFPQFPNALLPNFSKFFDNVTFSNPVHL